jgi:hypothetical protein
MLKLRGDLKLELDRLEEGLADYEQVSSVVPDSRAAAEAQTAIVARRVREATVAADVEIALAAMLRVHRIPAARTSPEAGRLRDLLIRIDFWISQGGLGYIAAAEAARYELRAPALARNLFLRYAEEEPDALWAAKAILAALDLTDLDSPGPGADELRGRLLEDYSDSAYVESLIGGSSARFSYEDLELGLRRQLQRLQRLADQEVRDRTTQRTGRQ